MLDATRLRVLVAIARHGSVTAAAQALNYAQPSISHHIARLEAETGAKLMERAGRGVKLTDAGQLLAARAEEILGRLDAAEAELATHMRQRQHRVRVASFGSALATFVAEAAATLRSERPDCDVHLVQAEPAEALHLLKTSEADVAVVYRYLLDDGAEVSADDGVVLLAEPLYLVTAQSAGTELAGRTPPWIATGEDCDDLLHELGQRGGFTPNVSMRVDDFLTAQALAAAGLGTAILPGLALRAARHPAIQAAELPDARREVRAVVSPGAAGAGPAVASLVGALMTAASRRAPSEV
ncbi:MAG TPA: LysR family transcriptional regulator [Streptosporangiaceae bacterium]|nr:LysR family transcriptional regulator [Streptosporangiaceae bacterium]